MKGQASFECGLVHCYKNYSSGESRGYGSDDSDVVVPLIIGVGQGFTIVAILGVLGFI
jgi:hypothetical protein